MYLVDQVVKAVQVPVIGMGGIWNIEDALDFLRVGVSAVAVGTATLTYPSAIPDIVDGLEKYLTEKGYANMLEFKQKEGPIKS